MEAMSLPTQVELEVRSTQKDNSFATVDWRQLWLKLMTTIKSDMLYVHCRYAFTLLCIQNPLALHQRCCYHYAEQGCMPIFGGCRP